MALQQRFLPHASLALRRATLSSAAVWCVSAPLSALAAGPGPDDGKDGNGSTWGLGLGVVSTQKAYRDFDRENRALPMIQYENRWVRVFGPGLTVKLPGVQLGPTQRLELRRERLRGERCAHPQRHGRAQGRVLGRRPCGLEERSRRPGRRVDHRCLRPQQGPAAEPDAGAHLAPGQPDAADAARGSTSTTTTASAPARSPPVARSTPASRRSTPSWACAACTCSTGITRCSSTLA